MLTELLRLFDGQESGQERLGEGLRLLHRAGMTWDEARQFYRATIEAGLLEFNDQGGMVLTDAGRDLLSAETIGTE